MLFTELRLPLSSTPVVWCDNKSAISLASFLVFHAWSKHIEIDCHFIREKIIQQQLSVHHVPSEFQQADILTKALSLPKFYIQVSACTSPQLEGE